MGDGEVLTRNGLYGFEFRDVDNRRKEGDERKTYEIKQMWQRSHEICCLAVKGYKQVEIAEILDIDPQTVSNTLNSQLGKEKLSVLRLEKDEEAKKISEKVRMLTTRALTVYNKILENESGVATVKDQKDVADTVLLELSGLRVPTRIQSSSVHTTLTVEELEEFKRRGIAAAKESGMCITVEPIVEPEVSQ